MQVKLNDKVIFEIGEIAKQIICDSINKNGFAEEFEKALVTLLQKGITEFTNAFLTRWENTVVNDKNAGPLPYIKQNLEAGEVPEDFVNVVLKRPYYKDKHERDIEHLGLAPDIIALENQFENFTKGLAGSIKNALLPAFDARKNAIAQADEQKRQAIMESQEIAKKAAAAQA